MFARINTAINSYITEASKYDFKLFGEKINVLHKGDGVKRAKKYKAGIARVFGDEDLIIRTVFKDVAMLDKHGELGTSYDLRLALLFALFEQFGKTGEQMDEIYNDACWEAHSEYIMPDSGVSITIDNEWLAMKYMINVLEDLMKKKGYSLETGYDEEQVNVAASALKR